jgi:hypothetical protein
MSCLRSGLRQLLAPIQQGRRNLPSVRVAHMRLFPRDDGIAILAIQVAQPVEALAAPVFAHDSIDAAWRNGLSFQKATDDGLVWATGLGPAAELPPLPEVGNLNTEGDPTWGPLRPKPGANRWVFLKPENSGEDWVTGQSAQAELTRIEQSREQRYKTSLIATGTSQSAPEFLILAIADNLLITQPQRVPGISLFPLTSDLGDDVRNVLTKILRERGVATVLQAIPRSEWLAKM